MLHYKYSYFLFFFERLSGQHDASLLNILTPAFLNLTSEDRTREVFLSHGGPDIMLQYIEKNWINCNISEGMSNEFVNNLLGPLQVLLNIMVSENERFIAPNEEILWKIVKIGAEIALALGMKTILEFDQFS